jgi:hypothetical protein
MNPDYVFLTFAAIVGAILLWFLIQMIRNRGYRGALFGAPVARKIGEIDFGWHGLMRTKMKIYALERRDDGSPEVGIEVASSVFLGYHVSGFGLTREQTRAVGVLLSQAAGESRTS